MLVKLTGPNNVIPKRTAQPPPASTRIQPVTIQTTTMPPKSRSRDPSVCSSKESKVLAYV
ncbi:hypothetical protein BDW66DRAFT_143677 [Aspergillus desertorum]